MTKMVWTCTTTINRKNRSNRSMGLHKNTDGKIEANQRDITIKHFD